MAGFVVGGGIFYPTWAPLPASGGFIATPVVAFVPTGATQQNWSYWDVVLPWWQFVQPTPNRTARIPAFVVAVPRILAAQYDWPISYEWVQVSQGRAPPPTGPAHYPNYAPRPTTRQDWDFWPGYEGWLLQPVARGTSGLFLPSCTFGSGAFGSGPFGTCLENSTPCPATNQNLAFWPVYDWYASQSSTKWLAVPAATAVAATPFTATKQYDWPSEAPQQRVVRSPFAPTGPAPYPNCASRPATRQDTDYYPGYDFSQVQPSTKSPFAPTGPRTYPNAAPPQHRQDYDEWPTYDWSYAQPPVKSPFAQTGPARYPNYAVLQRVTQYDWPLEFAQQHTLFVTPGPPSPSVVFAPERDWRFWPTYDWGYVQPPTKSPFAPTGSAPYPNYAAFRLAGQYDWPVEYPQQHAAYVSPPPPLPRVVYAPEHDWGFWPTYDWVGAQPPTKSPFAATGPATYPNYAPQAASVPLWAFWPDPTILQPAAHAVLTTPAYVPNQATRRYDWLQDYPQQPTAHSPFAPTGSAAYPNYASQSATNPNWSFWPGYEAWYHIQPPPKSPFAISGPAPYPNYAPLSTEPWNFWSLDYPQAPRPFFVAPPPPEQVVNVPEHDWQFWPSYDWTQAQPPTKSPFAQTGPAPYPNYAPYRRITQYDWPVDQPQQRGQYTPVSPAAVVPTTATKQYDWPTEYPQQAVARSPFAQTGSAPYPNTAPPQRRQDVDYWPTYDWSYVQPPAKSPFAPTGPAPYPNYAAAKRTTQYDWPLDLAQQRALFVTPGPPSPSVVYAPERDWGFWPTYDWVGAQPPIKSPFAATGPAPYPNYAARPATKQDFDEWPTYDFSYVQPPIKSSFAPSSYSPRPNRQDFDYWPAYEAWYWIQPPVKSAFAQTGPRPYPNYAARSTTDQNFAFWPGYEAFSSVVRPAGKSPFAPTGPLLTYAKPLREDWDFWPGYEVWKPLQPQVKSPFAPKGPRPYPNYAPVPATRQQWAPWPEYDFSYVQKLAKSPFAPSGPIVLARATPQYNWPVDLPQQTPTRSPFAPTGQGAWVASAQQHQYDFWSTYDYPQAQPPTKSPFAPTGPVAYPNYAPYVSQQWTYWPAPDAQQSRTQAVVVAPTFVPALRSVQYDWPQTTWQHSPTRSPFAATGPAPYPNYAPASPANSWAYWPIAEAQQQHTYAVVITAPTFVPATRTAQYDWPIEYAQQRTQLGTPPSRSPVVLAAPTRDWNFWPSFDWYQPGRFTPVPPPGVVPFAPTSQYVWPEPAIQQPHAQSPFATTGPASYPNYAAQRATRQDYDYYPTYDFSYVQPPVKSPFALTPPPIFPPLHRQDFDEWPTYDFAYVQPPQKSPFATDGPAPYPNYAPRPATSPNWFSWPDVDPQRYPIQPGPTATFAKPPGLGVASVTDVRVQNATVTDAALYAAAVTDASRDKASILHGQGQSANVIDFEIGRSQAVDQVG